MATSSNTTIQGLMDEAQALDPTDLNLEEKLNLIAQKVAAEQRKIKAAVTGVDELALVDPADAFACEGCQ